MNNCKRPAKPLPRKWMARTALVGGIVILGLRIAVRHFSLEADGLLRRGDPLMPIIAALSGVVILALWILSRRCRCSSKYADQFPPSDLAAIGQLACGLLVLLGGLTAGLSGQDRLAQAAGYAMAACGGYYILLSGSRRTSRRPNPWTALLPALVWALWLVNGFRGWTRDPHVHLYAFELLFTVWAMLGFYHWGAFSLDHGSGSSAGFYGWGTVYFALASLPELFYLPQLQTRISTILVMAGVCGLLAPLGPVGTALPSAEAAEKPIEATSGKASAESPEKPEDSGK